MSIKNTLVQISPGCQQIRHSCLQTAGNIPTITPPGYTLTLCQLNKNPSHKQFDYTLTSSEILAPLGPKSSSLVKHAWACVIICARKYKNMVLLCHWWRKVALFFNFLLLCKNVCRCYHEQKVRSGIIYVFVFFRLFFSRTNSRKTTVSHARSWTLILTKTTLVCIKKMYLKCIYTGKPHWDMGSYLQDWPV